MKASILKSLMIGVALCAVASPSFAATTSNGSTTVTTQTYPSSAYQTGQQAQYPHQDMGSLGSETETTTTTVGTTAGSTPLNNVARTRTAAASTTSSSGAISNPQQIGQCLCMQQSYQSLQNDVSAKQSAYDNAVAQRASLTTELSTERANAKDEAEINTVRATSEKLIVLQNQINGQYIPQLQSATSTYNAAVGQYRTSCAGKSFDANVEAQVQSNLQCHG